MKKFYLAKIVNLDHKTIEIKQGEINFEFVNYAQGEVVITGNIKKVKDIKPYYFLEILGGLKNPYHNKILDTGNKYNPLPKEGPELSIKYSYLIDITNGYVLGLSKSFPMLVKLYKKHFNKDIKISYFVPDIDEYLSQLYTLSECKIIGELSKQNSLLNFGEKYHNDRIEKLGFGVGTKIELKITSGIKHDLQKFKKHIKDYDLKFITIKGKNQSGNEIKYHNNAIKHIYEVEVDDNLSTNLKEFLKNWIKNYNTLENKKT